MGRWQILKKIGIAAMIGLTGFMIVCEFLYFRLLDNCLEFGFGQG